MSSELEARLALEHRAGCSGERVQSYQEVAAPGFPAPGFVVWCQECGAEKREEV